MLVWILSRVYHSSHHLDVILVVVYRLSKAAHFIRFTHPYTAPEVGATFAREIIHWHGVPQSIVCDRDPIFVSAFWSKLFKPRVPNFA